MDIIVKNVITTLLLDITYKQITDFIRRNNHLSSVKNRLDLHFIDQPLIHSVI